LLGEDIISVLVTSFTEVLAADVFKIRHVPAIFDHALVSTRRKLIVAYVASVFFAEEGFPNTFAAAMAMLTKEPARMINATPMPSIGRRTVTSFQQTLFRKCNWNDTWGVIIAKWIGPMLPVAVTPRSRAHDIPFYSLFVNDAKVLVMCVPMSRLAC
jgi:hypothetical protein